MKVQLDNYFREIDQKVAKTYKVAERARKVGHDPEEHVGVHIAKNMAERVEGLIGALLPQIINSGLAKRIQELESKYGKLDWRVALSIALEVSNEKFCKFENKTQAMESGIRRVGLLNARGGVKPA